tara:strand:+ start:1000 stop:1590 length:591 start_codon:yes stop_codon:yes gene_type:complete
VQYIKHRINSLVELEKLPEGLGAELDLRAKSDSIYIHHDPFQSGDDFEDYLKLWVSRKRGTLILNTKEDGLEEEVLNLLGKYSVKDFFFLDTAFPTLVKWSLRKAEKRFAVRISEYEDIQVLNHFRAKLDWVWLDSFSGLPASPEILKQLNGFKVCLVSPELQSYAPEKIQEFKEQLGGYLDAVCTKLPEEWGWQK